MAQSNNQDSPSKGGNPPANQVSPKSDTTVVDIIVLKSGAVFRGTILSFIENIYYRIKLQDGTVLDFETRLVEQVLKERVVNGRVISNTGQEVTYKAPDKYASMKQYFLAGGANLNLSLPFYADISTDGQRASISYNLGFHGLGGYRLSSVLYLGGILGYNVGKGQYVSSNSSRVVSYDETMFSYGVGPIWKSSLIGGISYQYVFIGQDFSAISYDDIVFDPNSGISETVGIKDNKHSLSIGTGILVEITSGLGFLTETRFNYFRGSGNLNARLGLVYSPNLIGE